MEDEEDCYGPSEQTYVNIFIGERRYECCRYYMVLAEVFISESKSTSYLENITNIDSVPLELLLIIRNTVFVDTTTNRTLVIPKP